LGIPHAGNLDIIDLLEFQQKLKEQQEQLKKNKR
jgi:hypothetical protein